VTNLTNTTQIHAKFVQSRTPHNWIT